MAVQAMKHLIPRVDLLRAVLPLFVVGVLLIVLRPEKESGKTDARVAGDDRSLRSVPPQAARL